MIEYYYFSVDIWNLHSLAGEGEYVQLPSKVLTLINYLPHIGKLARWLKRLL